MTKYILLVEAISFITVILSSLFYLVERLSTNKIDEFHRSINFYIGITVLMWWLITTPIMFYDIYLRHGDERIRNIKDDIFLVANFVMYLSFALSLVICRPQEEDYIT